METLDDQRCFEGRQLRLRFESEALHCPTTVSVFLPPAAEEDPVPVLYWLSGLTCDDQNFTTKAGAQRTAAELGLALVAPDTSPRGDDVPDDAEGAFDFGKGAGFYVDATEAPFDRHYRMWSFVTGELPRRLHEALPLDGARMGISGHSMGGHGALTIALRHPERYRSASAFAPICSPTRCPWGEKALSGYLGSDREAWAAHDASLLVAARPDVARALPMRIEQGSADPFLETQLKPELLLSACSAADVPLEYALRSGYDHSYYFVASFIEDHLRFHHGHLAAAGP